jgi:hypothetical protein
VVAARQQAEQALQGLNQELLSPQQKRQMLLNHPNPNIRAKSQLAAKHSPGQLRAASLEPPEIKAQMQEADNAMKGINQGRLSSQQRRQMLLAHPNPRIREKAQEAQRVKLQPRGSLDSPNAVASLSALRGLLNPFAATEAQAQGSFAVTLTPQQLRSSSPSANLIFFGGMVFGSTSGFTQCVLVNSSNSIVGFATVKPEAIVSVNIPSAGWYLLDFYGNGKPKATLREFVNGQYPVLETWDMTTSPIGKNHFATAEYLAKGSHSFYFTVDTAQLVFYEASIEAF